MPFTLTMPKLSPTMEEGQITKWHAKEGDYVKAGALLLEIATDKATIEHNALDEGWLRKILIPEKKIAKINQPIAIFTETKEESIEGFLVTPPKEPKIESLKSESLHEAPEQTPANFSQPSFVPEKPPKIESRQKRERGQKIVASPLAKKLAEENNLDLTFVKGSGPHGRITSKDLEGAPSQSFLSFSGGQESDALPGSFEELELSPMRKAIAKRLQESKSFIPHFYVKVKIDAEPMVLLREQLKNLGIKVTLNDLMIRACALALAKHPEVNRGFNSVTQSIIQFKTIDISVAVTLDEGLITPIIRQADFLNLQEIGIEMRQLAQKAREGKLKEEEYKGGSFCLSNLGMFGIEEFSAVINPPQAAILAVGGVQQEPVVKGAQVVAGQRLSLVLSADHRVIDGVVAATFLKTLQQILENPISLIA